LYTPGANGIGKASAAGKTLEAKKCFGYPFIASHALKNERLIYYIFVVSGLIYTPFVWRAT